MTEARNDQPLISVVIPTYNERNRIRSCLNSLYSQELAHRFEVIVVDSSEDDTPDIVRREFPTVKLVRRKQQTYPAEARNIGIDNAEGAIVAFIDADCIADQSWLEAVAAVRGESLAAVGGAIGLSSPTTLAGAALFAIEFSEYGRGSPKRTIRWLPSCNLAVKRSMILEHGNFPTDMQASEDMLFTRQLMRRSGKPLIFDPRMRISHSNVNTWNQLRGKMRTLGWWSGRSRATGLVPGGMLLRYKSAIPLLVPYRLLVVVIRLILWSRDLRLIAMAVFGWPLLAYGLVVWAGAFFRGAIDVSER